MTDRIGLIGAGNMGKALIQGLIESQTRQPEQIMVNDRDYGRMQSLEREWGVKACHDKAELVRRAESWCWPVSRKTSPEWPGNCGAI